MKSVSDPRVDLELETRIILSVPAYAPQKLSEFPLDVKRKLGMNFSNSASPLHQSQLSGIPYRFFPCDFPQSVQAF